MAASLIQMQFTASLMTCVTGAGSLRIGHLDCKAGNADIVSAGAVVSIGGVDGNASVSSNGGPVSLHALDNANVISISTCGGDITCTLSPQLISKGLTISVLGGPLDCDIPDMITVESSKREVMLDDEQGTASSSQAQQSVRPVMQMHAYVLQSQQQTSDHGRPSSMIALHARSLTPGKPHGRTVIRQQSWIESVQLRVKR